MHEDPREVAVGVVAGEAGVPVGQPADGFGGVRAQEGQRLGEVVQTFPQLREGVVRAVQQARGVVEDLVQRPEGRLEVVHRRAQVPQQRAQVVRDRLQLGRGRVEVVQQRDHLVGDRWHLVESLTRRPKCGGELMQRVTKLLLTARGLGGQPRQLGHDGADVVLVVGEGAGQLVEPGDKSPDRGPIGADGVEYPAERAEGRAGGLGGGVEVTLMPLDRVIQPVDQGTEVV